MKLGHFEALGPICPTCRTPEAEWPLILAHVWREDGEHILEGALHCSNSECQREHPILDGVPVLVPDLQAVVSSNPFAFLQREDLSGPLASLLGDALGPSSAYEQQRQRQSIYVDGHWGDNGRGGLATSSAAELMQAMLELGGSSSGPALELGCGPGRGCLELASAVDGLVLGLELDFTSARFAARLYRDGRADWLRRRVGLVYEPRTAVLSRPEAARVDVWMADALAPPFPAGAFGTVAAMNVLDSCPSPWGLLHSFASALKPGGTGVFASPYDWSPGATTVAQWLGGHSQRGPEEGSSEAAVRACLTPGNPRYVQGLSLLREADSLPWRLRVHDRSEVVYRVHGVAVGRV